MIKRLALAATLATLVASSAHAEYLGPVNGRSANPGSLPELSVEGNFATSDFYQNIGGRVNYRVSPELVVFGDLGLIELGPGFADADGLGFGFGAYFYLANQQFLSQMDVGVKGSYHFGSVEFDGVAFNPVTGAVTSSSQDLDVNNISLEALVSGKEALTAGGLMWYANAGIQIAGGDGPGDTELLIGGGVYMPVGPGEVFGGVDLIDELTLGVGYRYFFQ